MKFFAYRGKSFQFDFNIFKENSIYFYENRQSFKDCEKINLLDENEEKIIDLSDKIITTFISLCEGKVCQLDISNVIPLQFLSYKYDVPQLIEATKEFISDDFNQIAVKSILFKSKIINKDNIEWITKFIDCSKEELIITTHLIDFLQNEDLFLLPIFILDRIFSKFFQSKSGKLSNNSNEFINFLFKCLDNYGKKASVLFSYVDFECQSIDVVNRLISDYSNIFDFNMINSTLLKTTSQLTCELTKLRVEYSSEFSKMRKIFQDQNDEFNIIIANNLKKEKEEEEKSKKREKIFQE